MKAFALALVVFSFSNSAFAASAQVSCTGIETPEWNIVGGFGAGQIEFFDNDSWTKFNLVRVLESYPVQMVYEEEGAPENKIVIRGTVSESESTTEATYKGDNGFEESFTCEITY